RVAPVSSSPSRFRPRNSPSFLNSPLTANQPMRCMRRVRRWQLCAAAVIAAALTACSGSASTTSSAVAPASPPELATLDLTFDGKAIVGASVAATASGLPAGKTVDLRWGTVTGGWVIEDYYHFRGKKYSEMTTSLGPFPVDSSGRLNAAFDIPEDYGGVHEVIALVDDEPVAQNGIDVTQTFAMTPTSG